MCFKCWRNARTVQKTDWYAQNCCAHGFTGWHKRNKPHQTGQYTFIRCFRYATQCCAFVCFSHFLLILATGLPEPAELFSSFSLFQARSRSFFFIMSSHLCFFLRFCPCLCNNFFWEFTTCLSPFGSDASAAGAAAAHSSTAKFCAKLMHLIQNEQKQFSGWTDSTKEDSI